MVPFEPELVSFHDERRDRAQTKQSCGGAEKYTTTRQTQHAAKQCLTGGSIGRALAGEALQRVRARHRVEAGLRSNDTITQCSTTKRKTQSHSADLSGALGLHHSQIERDCSGNTRDSHEGTATVLPQPQQMAGYVPGSKMVASWPVIRAVIVIWNPKAGSQPHACEAARAARDGNEAAADN